MLTLEGGESDQGCKGKAKSSCVRTKWTSSLRAGREGGKKSKGGRLRLRGGDVEARIQQNKEQQRATNGVQTKRRAGKRNAKNDERSEWEKESSEWWEGGAAEGKVVEGAKVGERREREREGDCLLLCC